jgi:hypothetical protein
MRLRHEERLAGVQLANLERTMRTQKEQEDRQLRAERDRADRRAAVGKVVLDGAEEGGERRQVDQAARASKVAERAAQAQIRLEMKRQAAADDLRIREANSDAARQAALQQAEGEKRAQQARQQEQELLRAARIASKRVADEVHRAKVESARELAAQRSMEQRAQQMQMRENKRREQEVRDESHRENAERVRRAFENRAARTEASIEAKSQRCDVSTPLASPRTPTPRVLSAEPSRHALQAHARSPQYDPQVRAAQAGRGGIATPAPCLPGCAISAGGGHAVEAAVFLGEASSGCVSDRKRPLVRGFATTVFEGRPWPPTAAA